MSPLITGILGCETNSFRKLIKNKLCHTFVSFLEVTRLVDEGNTERERIPGILNTCLCDWADSQRTK